ncbi:hypothetical protein [Pedomonas sp. V897]|uniref:hypothetical protein n=1 Tax=Pedomonas sp. V897 TaxID=3446482 RepID=UPI003EDE9C0C
MRYYTGIIMALATAVSAAVCFAVSLEVGERRDEVMALKRQIAGDMREVRRLQAEWQIRVRPGQLQRLNDTYFGLTAPTADRYFASAESYVAFAADPNSEPQKPQVLPAIEQQMDSHEAPQTYLAKATDGGKAQLVAVSSDGPAVAMRLPSLPVYATVQKPRPSGFGEAAPKVHLASWSEPVAEPAPRPRKESIALAMRTPAETAGAEAYAPALPKKAAPLGGLDAATIASIERLAASEAGTQ